MKFRFLALVLTVLAILILTKRRETPTPETGTEVAVAPESTLQVISPKSSKIEKKAPQSPKVNASPNEPFESARNGEEDWTPTPEQAASLEQAMSKEQQWEKRRSDFLTSDLKLGEADISSLERMRRETLLAEEELMNGRAESSQGEADLRAKLQETRKDYEDRVQRLLGAQKWKSFVAFYGEYWSVPSPERISSYLPLK